MGKGAAQAGTRPQQEILGWVSRRWEGGGKKEEAGDAKGGDKSQ